MVPSPYHQMAANFAQGFATLAIVCLMAVNAVGVFVLPQRGYFVVGLVFAVLSCGMSWANWRLVATGAEAHQVNLVTALAFLLALASLVLFAAGAQ
jgi:hypothetical protein